MRHKTPETAVTPVPPGSDLVIDFTDSAPVDLGGLSLLLTAQQMAQEAECRIWLMALPHPTWRLLHALGLEDYFELFPSGGAVMN